MNSTCPLSPACGSACHWYESCPSSRLQSLTGPHSASWGHPHAPRVLRRADQRAARLALLSDRLALAFTFVGLALATYLLGSIGLWLSR